ncbi:MAG: ATP-grasp domain-containing protein [Candidatus Gracilibacteria bacterium]|nr:ATP-grasp domain-containing protein [Candidatus Gracilibacteria bacterium]
MQLAILTGGTSAERMVALRSAENMKQWMITAGASCEVFDFPTELPKFLTCYTHFDLVVPMFHGVYGEDGQITAFLKTLGCPYAFSPFEVHSLCLNKNQTNLFVEKMGIKVPRSEFYEQGRGFSSIATQLSFPLIVKPNKGGSSIATNKVSSIEEFQKAYEMIVDDDILVQTCIEGREFTVGVFRDATGCHALPIIEIQSLKNAFFDYQEKYETDGSNEVFLEGELSLQKLLADTSVAISQMLGCSGLVRIDFRYDGKDIYFLEVNTIPGFTAASLVPKMWRKAGKNEQEMLEILKFQIN